MKFPEQFRYQPDSPDPIGRKFHSKPGEPFGVFKVPALNAPGRRSINLIASDGEATGWDHVSVSVGSKSPPTWAEMCFVKDLFWDETECVVQFHPPKSDYVNIHPGVLHLWKAAKEPFPRPPKICV